MPDNKSKSALRAAPTGQMLRRALFLMAVFGVAAFAVLVARLYKLQIIDHEKYENLAVQQQLRSVSGAALRGTIYDTNMNALAVSASVDVDGKFTLTLEYEAVGDEPEREVKYVSEVLTSIKFSNDGGFIKCEIGYGDDVMAFVIGGVLGGVL